MTEKKQVIIYPAWHDEARRLKASGLSQAKIADKFECTIGRIAQIATPNWRQYLVIYRTSGLSKRQSVGSIDVEKYEFVANEEHVQRETDRNKWVAKARAKRRQMEEQDVSKERTFPTVKDFHQGMIKIGAVITCHKCHKSDRYFKATGSITPNYMEKEFKRMGWIVGGSPRADMCPDCAAALRPKIVKDFGQMNVTNIHTPSTGEIMTVTFPTQPIIPPSVEVKTEVQPVGIETIVQTQAPAELDKTSRRLILSKLNDVYEDEVLGYRDDWTDAKVATDLGVPVEWIKELRDDNFGPEINAAMREAAKQSVVADADNLNRLVVLIDRKLEQMQELDGKVSASIEECEKQLALMEKAMDRFEELKNNLQQSDAKMKELTDQFNAGVEDFKKKYADLKRSPSAA